METNSGERTRRPRLALALGATALLLAGCSDRILHTGLGYDYFVGEDPMVEDAVRPVRGMTGLDPNYPTIISVPDRPIPPPTPAERKRDLERLADDRRAGHLASDLLKEVAPLPIPAKPALTEPGAASPAVKPQP